MKIYAHRGSSILWPENTRAAFDAAHGAGATGFETDLRLASDGEIVLAHDPDLRRFGRPDVVIAARTSSELAQVTVSSPDGRHRGQLTTLRELLTAYPTKDYIFDCKISERRLFEVLHKLLEQHPPTGTIWFLTWSRRADAYLRALFPEFPCFPREPYVRLWGWARWLGLNNLFEPPYKLLALPAYYRGRPLFDAALIRSLHARGKTFLGYLVNTERDVRHCQACGVKNVLTDQPALVSSLVAAASHKKNPGP